MFEKVADGSWKYDPENYYWEVLREFRDQNMKYNCLKHIKPYKFKYEDEYGYFGDYVKKFHSYFDKKIDDSVSS